MNLKHLAASQLDTLSSEAAAAPRLRAHHNLHPEHADPVQRLAIAMEPGTYVRPHRHPHTWELLIVLRGALEVLVFGADGRTVRERATLDADHSRAFEMPAGTWHSVISRQPGTVVFEVKQGPYVPASASDVADWSPAEGEAGVDDLMEFLGSAAAGDRWNAAPRA